MVWDEPGNGKNKDPWGGNSNKGQQPPDLDEVLRKFQQKFNELLGRRGGGAGGDNGNRPRIQLPFASIGAVVGILFVIYLLSGIYIVKPPEQAAVFRFGRYIDSVGPGPHWIARGIESKQVINVDQVLTSQHEGQMLTKDENIVSVELAVQFKISNVKDYLLNVTNPINTLEQATESAMRQVIGHSTLNDILTSGRDLIRDQIKEQVIGILNQYNTGLQVLDVAMQPAKAPDEVKEAFDDAIKAQEDEQRSINQALAYEKQTVPVAEGQAQRILAEAQAYQQQIILHSEGEANKFLELLPQYQKAPAVTRDRMYIETLEEVLSNTSKIVVDTTKNNNSMFYLPLDKLMAGSQAAANASLNPSNTSAATTPPQQPTAADKSANQTGSRDQGNMETNDPRARSNFNR